LVGSAVQLELAASMGLVVELEFLAVTVEELEG
jgi:hypothetical protein